MYEIVKFKPKALEELNDIVSNFTSSIAGERLRRMARHTRRRADLFREKEGFHFERLL